jgi:predicted AlkP superfamily pyrophosphatase or phosphodiesterase
MPRSAPAVASLFRLALPLLFALGACAPAPPAATAASRAALIPSEPTHGQNASGGVNAARWRAAPYVVLVSFDGFRPDYMERYAAPNLRRMAARGVRAERMIPVFPTKTFPAHYTLATGLYAENHGLVGNTFEDPRKPGRRYSLGDRVAVEDSSWYGGEPIWVTAEKQGMVAGAFFWVGSETAVQGVRPTFWHRFNDSIPSAARVDQALGWLSLPPERRPHLITLYFSDVDGAGHDAGPDSPDVAAAVARVDGLLGRLLDGVVALPHGREVTVIVVSDHGMAGYGASDAIVLDVDRLTGVRIVEVGPYASLFVPGADATRLRAARDTLRAMVGERAAVYLRAEVPARFHYSAHPAAGDIVIVPRGTGVIVASPNAARFRPGFNHGWDNLLPEMAATFVAMGPRLAAGRTLPPFEAVHVYPLVAELLGLAPAPVDGRIDVWRGVLTPP